VGHILHKKLQQYLIVQQKPTNEQIFKIYTYN